MESGPNTTIKEQLPWWAEDQLNSEFSGYPIYDGGAYSTQWRSQECELGGLLSLAPFLSSPSPLPSPSPFNGGPGV